MDFEITDNINEKDSEIIFKGLLEYNLERIEDKNPMDLGISLHDETGRTVAGLIGSTHGN
ncbi:MAG: acetyltransferase [Lacrimispora sp.]|jgi:hypothetical protein|nr:acetyltransferase [Lacrimispora sp.]